MFDARLVIDVCMLLLGFVLGTVVCKAAHAETLRFWKTRAQTYESLYLQFKSTIVTRPLVDK